LLILGSSGALPVNGRFTTSQLLSVANHQFLIDCGEACQHQLRKFEVSQHKINHIFVSHLHGDHYLGLTGLLFSMHLLHREHDLHLYSFRGLEDILLAQFRHAHSVPHFKIVFHPLTEAKKEVIFEDEHVSVESFPMDHKIPTCGFIFREKPPPLSLDKSKDIGSIPVEYLVRLKRGEDILNEKGEVTFRSADYTLPPRPLRSYAYCSDTQPSPQVVSAIKGIDLVYHEATFMESEISKARETRHSTAAEAAAVARDAGAGRLIIGHFSARYKELNLLLDEAVKIFPNTALALEGESFELTD